MHSSRTTTTGAITRASTISPRPTSTSGAVKPSCWKEKGSNARPSKTVGCFTTNKPRNINHDAPDSLLVHAASCLKISDDGHDVLVWRLGRGVADRVCLEWNASCGWSRKRHCCADRSVG